MSLRGALARFLLAPFVAVGGDATAPCPLCLGTDRGSILYETNELTDHAVKAHTFEDIYSWTRECAEAFNLTDVVEGLDTAFAVATDLSTRYQSTDQLTRWSWTCQRCFASRGGYATETAARLDRTTTHRCPAPLTGWVGA